MNKIESLEKLEESLAFFQKAKKSAVIESKILLTKKSIKELKESMQDSIQAWYLKKYKRDKYYGEKIADNATFDGLLNALKNNIDVYEYIFGDDTTSDSVVRERVFDELSNRKGIDYEDIYQLWINSDSEEDKEFVDGAVSKLASKYECKVNKLGKPVRKITEGAGAAYDVRALDYSLVNINKCEVAKEAEEDDYNYRITFAEGLDVEVTCRVEGESYYEGGIVPAANAKITALEIIVEKDYWEKLKEENRVRDIIKDEIYSLKTKSKQGGGWFHKTFTGVLASGVDDIAESDEIISAVITMTNQEQIDFLDNGIDNGNSFVQYVVYKDDDMLGEPYPDEKEAIQAAMKADADKVEARGFCQTEFGGDVEEIPEDITTVWSKDKSATEESVSSSEEALTEELSEDDKMNRTNIGYIENAAQALLGYVSSIKNNEYSQDAIMHCASEIANYAQDIKNAADKLKY